MATDIEYERQTSYKQWMLLFDRENPRSFLCPPRPYLANSSPRRALHLLSACCYQFSCIFFAQQTDASSLSLAAKHGGAINERRSRRQQSQIGQGDHTTCKKNRNSIVQLRQLASGSRWKNHWNGKLKGFLTDGECMGATLLNKKTHSKIGIRSALFETGFRLAGGHKKLPACGWGSCV